MKLNISMELMRAIDFASDEALRTGSYSVGADHLMLGIIREGTGPACEALGQMGIDLQEMKLFIDGRITTGEHISYDKRSEITLSNQSHSIISLAIIQSKRFSRNVTTSLEVLVAICTIAGTVTKDFLLDKGVDTLRLVDYMQQLYKNAPSGGSDGQKEPEAPEEPRSQGPIFGPFPIMGPDPNAMNLPTKLEDYGFDMTEAASKGVFGQTIGRKTEITRMIQILGRKCKNNPMLVGDSGTGKSSIIYEIARLIANGKVPRSLQGKMIFSLDIASVVAGTKFRGEFEKRMKDIISEVKKRGNVILFIDEFHTIVGAGETMGGGLDAAGILRPALSRSEIHCIGCTTADEYAKIVEKDKGLDRCFQKISVEPTDIPTTIKILKAHREEYQLHHNVTYSDSVIEDCVKLSNRYITDRCLPDKAMDVMDETGSMVRLKSRSAKKTARVTEADVAKVISMISSVPVERIAQKESQKLQKMEETLSERIIGQSEAVSTVCTAIRRSRSGIKDPRRPIGTFLFMGPTGVGKTQLAKSLADYLFDSEDNMVRIDMSEYGDKINVSKLIGAPPGYVGYDQGGQLSEAVRRKPYCVVLLDEIEKAHPDVFNLLLQVLDDGRLTDSNSRVVNFRNTIIIMTSNVGSRQMQEYGSGIGFAGANDESVLESKRKGVADKAIKQTFPPEFLNRIDEQIFFHSLGKEEMETILDIELKDLRTRLKDLGYRMEVSPEARKFIALWGYDPLFGARPIRRSIRKWVEDPISQYLIDNPERLSGCIKVEMSSDGKFTKICG